MNELPAKAEPMSENVRECPISKVETPPSTPTDQQLVAIEMLAHGQPLGNICKALSIDPRTLYRWRMQPQFRETLTGRIDAVWDDARQRLRALTGRAVDALEMQTRSPNANEYFKGAEVIIKLSGLHKAMLREQADGSAPPRERKPR